MKLKLRSVGSNETFKVDVPDPCTLPQLKQIISQSLRNSPSPASICLSLNRKDELQSQGDESLRSIGITAGDLLYLSIGQPAGAVSSNPFNPLPQEPKFTPKTGSSDSECSTILNSDSVNSDAEKVGTLRKDEMELDMEDNGDSNHTDMEVVGKSFSVPSFLRKVFVEELGGESGRNHKMIVIAVHAVMLESGFIGFDKNANMVIDGFRFRDEWPSGLFSVSLCYTLPEIKVMKSVELKFQSLGKFINVYGTVVGNASGNSCAHRVQLNEDQLVPYLNVVWANCGVMESIGECGGDFSGTSPEKEVFKFWRTVKDCLALPLLIDLCEVACLQLPPCFMRLPTDLKLKIMESLPGADVAKVSCVCSELRYLGTSDDLWKLKFEEEFANERKESQSSWKMSFALASERRNIRKRSRYRAPPYWPPLFPGQARGRRQPNPFMVPRVPRIIGGDHDLLPPPFLRHGDSLQTRLHDSVNHPMRSFSPPCNLGARDGRFV